MKRWNRMNEQLGDAAERAAVAADWLGGAIYPDEQLRDAWIRFLVHQFHDDLTGTSIPDAYLFSWNDEVLSLNRFASVLESSVGAVARALDTSWVKGIPVVVYNPLSIERTDVVEAGLTFPNPAPEHVRVFDPKGSEVLSQYSVERTNTRVAHKLLFVAVVPAAGWVVYDVRPSDQPCSFPSPVAVDRDGRWIENGRYRVTIGKSGDITSLVDRDTSKELVADGEAFRLQLFEDKSRSWPAWEILPEDIDPNIQPRFVDGPPTIETIETGPVRAAVCVTRMSEDTIYEQTIQLYADGLASAAVEVVSRIDWHEDTTLLKASFPLTVSNEQATYDLGWGAIVRPNSIYDSGQPRARYDKYEVPGHQWVDLAHQDNTYGVSILTDCKYGWDKPSDNELRLTLIHTPPRYGCNGGSYDRRDFGPNPFRYAICGHRDSWASAGIPWNAAAFNQPLRAFQTVAHEGTLDRSLPFVDVDTDQVAIMALKKREPEAERNGRNCDVIVRLRELTGHDTSSPAGIRVGAGIEEAREVTGEEDDLGPAAIADGRLEATLGPFQVRTFAVRLNPPSEETRLRFPTSHPANLPFDSNVVGLAGRFDDSGRAFPADLFPGTVVSEGIRFELGSSRGKNAIRCAEQLVALDPEGEHVNRLYLLAAASGEHDAEDVEFRLNERAERRMVPSITAHVGRWYDDGQRVRDDKPIWRTPADPYLKYATVAWHSTHLSLQDADSKRRTQGRAQYPYPPGSGSGCYPCDRYSLQAKDMLPYEFGYMFLLRYDLEGSGPWTLQLPDDDRILVFAVTLAHNENDDTFAAGRLYD